MKTIEIDDLVFASLERRVLRFGDTPNDVIKRLLDATENSTEVPDSTSRDTSTQTKHPLLKLIENAEYSIKSAKERYFDVLRVLYQLSPTNFERLEGFQRGPRVNISKKYDLIKNSGNNTNPEKLFDTPYYVLTNLDNARKREILHDVMKILGINPIIIKAVVNSIPDSGITRPRSTNRRTKIDLSVLDGLNL